MAPMAQKLLTNPLICVSELHRTGNQPLKPVQELLMKLLQALLGELLLMESRG